MNYTFEFSSQFERSVKKLKRKNKPLFDQVQKKLVELIENPEHYKPLRNILAGYRRIHFGHFILVYKIKDKIVRIISLDHHDRSY